jgi:hypothetical protein
VTSDRTSAAGSDPSAAGVQPIPEYEIRVAGRLTPRWSAWFDGLTVTAATDGTTVLWGPVVDEAALHGLLGKLRDAGIPLVSLNRLAPDAPTRPATHPNQKEHGHDHHRTRHHL